MRIFVNPSSAMFVLTMLVAAYPLATDVVHAQPAESYPTRAVRAIVPFGAGGATDFVARIVAPKLSQELGQQVVIENRPGAAGNIGVELAAQAAPDGYTVMFGNVGCMAINPSVFPKFPIKPLRDFIGVSVLSDMTIGIAIHPSVPTKTLKEFIAFAKARPGQLNYSSTGASSASRLALEFVMGKAGIKITHVPYKGGGGAATLAAITGEVEVTMQAISNFIPFLKSGRLRMLAVVASKRVAQLPDVPTLAESGFPELTLGSWHGLYVLKGTPRPIVDRLHAAIIKVMKDPEVAERYRAAGAVVTVSNSPEEFATFQKTQTEFWAKLVNELGAVEK